MAVLDTAKKNQITSVLGIVIPAITAWFGGKAIPPEAMGEFTGAVTDLIVAAVTLGAVGIAIFKNSRQSLITDTTALPGVSGVVAVDAHEGRLRDNPKVVPTPKDLSPVPRPPSA